MCNWWYRRHHSCVAVVGYAVVIGAVVGIVVVGYAVVVRAVVGIVVVGYAVVIGAVVGIVVVGYAVVVRAVVGIVVVGYAVVVRAVVGIVVVGYAIAVRAVVGIIVVCAAGRNGSGRLSRSGSGRLSRSAALVLSLDNLSGYRMDIVFIFHTICVEFQLEYRGSVVMVKLFVVKYSVCRVYVSLRQSDLLCLFRVM